MPPEKGVVSVDSEVKDKGYEAGGVMWLWQLVWCTYVPLI
jgi:hypothetical protein